MDEIRINSIIDIDSESQEIQFSVPLNGCYASGRVIVRKGGLSFDDKVEEWIEARS